MFTRNLYYVYLVLEDDDKKVLGERYHIPYSPKNCYYPVDAVNTASPS